MSETSPQVVVQPPKKKVVKKPVSRNAFTAFEDEILQKVVLPKIAAVLAAHPKIEGKGGFIREFRKACQCRVSQGTMDAWLKKLGISFKRQVTVDFPENVQMTFEEIYKAQQKKEKKNGLDGHPVESKEPKPEGDPDDDFKFHSEQGKVQ